MNSQANYRFARLELALGSQAIASLNHAFVTVIGLGGVGGSAAETLVRSGVGHVRLVDTDICQPSDINRQIFSLSSTIGHRKVDVAEQRLLDINPALIVKTDHMFFHADTAPLLLNPKPDWVIDAIDAVLPKVELLSYCVNHRIPVISCMGAAQKQDWRQIRISAIQETSFCPLARIIRRRLGRRGIREGITCVYSTEAIPPESKVVPESDSLVSNTRGRPRPPMGSYAPIVNMFGILAADFVIHAIVKK